MTGLSISSVTFVFLFTLLFAEQAHGWANRLKCNLKLSTDTKIMKRNVKASSSARHPVQVQIKRGSEQGWSSFLDSDPNDETIQVRLQFPEELMRQGVEWVVEVSPPEAAEFVGKLSGCRGRRATSKMEEPVSLRVIDQSIPITIVGGYAAGFEAVTLTDPIQIGAIENEARKEL